MALVGLDMRELWITFRLLLVLGTLLLSGLLPALLSVVAPSLASGSVVYADALAAAVAVASAIAAFSLSAERCRGSGAWLVVRAVPRSALLLAWLASVAGLLLMGLLASAVIAWLSLLAETGATGLTIPFGLTMVAVGAAGLMALSGGLLLGALLRPRLAAAVTLLVSGAVLLASLLLTAAAWLPTGGFSLLAGVSTAGRPLASALQSAGAGLLAAALLLAVALAVLQRADL